MINTSYQSYIAPATDFDTALLAVAGDFAGRSPATHTLLEGPEGAVWLERLPWDTQVLGVESARVNVLFTADADWSFAGARALLRRVADECERDGIRFCTFRLRPAAPAVSDALAAEGWLLRDALNVYTVPPAGSAPQPDSTGAAVVRLSAAELSGRFDEFATTFRHARINRDSNISADRAVGFYRALFESVAAKEDGFRVGVVVDDCLAGFAIGALDTTYRTRLGIELAYLWQIAIQPEYRSRHLSAVLLAGFLEACPPGHVVELETQFDNIPANRLYTRAGLVLTTNAMTFHRWF